MTAHAPPFLRADGKGAQGLDAAGQGTQDGPQWASGTSLAQVRRGRQAFHEILGVRPRRDPGQRRASPPVGTRRATWRRPRPARPPAVARPWAASRGWSAGSDGPARGPRARSRSRGTRRAAPRSMPSVAGHRPCRCSATRARRPRRASLGPRARATRLKAARDDGEQEAAQLQPAHGRGPARDHRLVRAGRETARQAHVVGEVGRPSAQAREGASSRRAARPSARRCPAGRGARRVPGGRGVCENTPRISPATAPGQGPLAGEPQGGRLLGEGATPVLDQGAQGSELLREGLPFVPGHGGTREARGDEGRAVRRVHPKRERSGRRAASGRRPDPRGCGTLRPRPGSRRHRPVADEAAGGHRDALSSGSAGSSGTEAAGAPAVGDQSLASAGRRSALRFLRRHRHVVVAATPRAARASEALRRGRGGAPSPSARAGPRRAEGSAAAPRGSWTRTGLALGSSQAISSSITSRVEGRTARGDRGGGSRGNGERCSCPAPGCGGSSLCPTQTTRRYWSSGRRMSSADVQSFFVCALVHQPVVVGRTRIVHATQRGGGLTVGQPVPGGATAS